MSSESLTIDNAEHALRAMLEAADLSADALKLETAWTVFGQFCERPIKTESDGLLVQWGPTYEWLPKPPYEGRKIGFSYSVLRQFDDGNQEFEQLTLEWRYSLDNTLDSIPMGNSSWCFAEVGCDFADFLRQQQQSDLFLWLKQQTPYETAVFQENTG